MRLPSFPSWPRRLVVAGFAGAALLAACGGGVGTGGTGSYAQGSIGGFGSVIVNQVHFDDSAATVLDADGAARSAGDLRLGMTVEIEASAITQSGGRSSARASLIRYASEIVGPVAAVDAAASRFTVLGQTVEVGATTVFDDRLAGGLAALAEGALVEVYAAFDAASGRYRATRIEPRASAGAFRLRGPVRQLDTGARRFRIGGAQFAYSGSLPAGLVDGAFVRLQLQPAAADSAIWSVLSVGGGVAALPDADEAQVKGLITAFTSASAFSVNGQPVTAAGASFPDGSAGLALGVRVEVEGRARGGVLQATQVAIESDAEEAASGYELDGAITSVDTAARRFVLRGVTVSYARADLELTGGTLADLAPGRTVEVEGVLSADGTVVEATHLQFDR